MLFEELPRIVRSSIFLSHLDPHRLQRHLATAEDSDFLRKSLAARGLVAFIADGAALPRARRTSFAPAASPSAGQLAKKGSFSRNPASLASYPEIQKISMAEWAATSGTMLRVRR